MSTDTMVDAVALREEVKQKYREVAVEPHGSYHFHTGRPLARRLGYDDAVVGALPDVAVESFAGVGDPFSLRPLEAGERVVDIGSGGGFDDEEDESGESDDEEDDDEEDDEDEAMDNVLEAESEEDIEAELNTEIDADFEKKSEG